ncbi:hypothetical protein JET18_05540 [Chryseobacterium sp. L7]|uniref:Uncharacterized protein n=1 Tax=Chryseobacterium endalhagicum TaxID=2797638 RepID=A0ABS1QCF8_9FLAO|nr:hypothetical protein [Chryseobacterium endalhagicum]MBL1220290.1 hypothetical protein [Chryseobacterium endalhagicum]
MKDYIKYLLPYKQKFPIVNLTRRELVAFENLVVKYLNVRDLNELRDKFEGQAFMDNFLGKSIPIAALQKYLKFNLIDLEKINVARYNSKVSICGKTINIIMFDFNLPLIDINNDNPYIFIYSTEYSMLQICGFASAETVRENLKDVKEYGFGSKQTLKGKFYGFDGLVQFNNIIELEKLLLN